MRWFLGDSATRGMDGPAGRTALRPGRGTPQAALKLSWLPKCTSMRTRPGWVEPEVYFRIVHLTQVAQRGAPLAPCREQTVEISLEPKGTFENGIITAVTRQVPPDSVVRTALPPGGRLKSLRQPRTPGWSSF
jgi:hypothetical protein